MLCFVYMHTSKEWWNSVKNDPEKLTDWLRDQYRGEVTASARIAGFSAQYAQPGSHDARVLAAIADQEDLHAQWVGGLLRARGETPRVEDVPERYWSETLPGITSLESGAAVGAHAEAMRLERIRTIANDPEAPEDIRAVFTRILPQEEFHERAFREMAGPLAMAGTQASHEAGMAALGLAA